MGQYEWYVMPSGLKNHSIDFAEEFPGQIKDRNQLKRFLGCLNYLADYNTDLAVDREIPSNRHRKNAPLPWLSEYTEAVPRRIEKLLILSLPDDDKHKIVESDAAIKLLR